jgi:hypothetical protein
VCGHVGLGSRADERWPVSGGVIDLDGLGRENDALDDSAKSCRSCRAFARERLLVQADSRHSQLGQLIGHIENANFLFYAMAGVEKPPATQNYELATDKTVLVKALVESLAFCDRTYASMTDANFGTVVKLPGAGVCCEIADYRAATGRPDPAGRRSSVRC